MLFYFLGKHLVRFNIIIVLKASQNESELQRTQTNKNKYRLKLCERVRMTVFQLYVGQATQDVAHFMMRQCSDDMIRSDIMARVISQAALAPTIAPTPKLKTSKRNTSLWAHRDKRQRPHDDS